MSVPVPLRLRPLEIGDLLDETFRMYRRHFLLFAGISVICAIPSAGLVGLFLGWASIVLQQSSSSTTVNGPFDLTTAAGILGIAAAALVINVLILPFSHAAVTFAACESALGRPVTPGGVFRGVLRRYFPLLGYFLLFNSFTAYLALLLCIAPFALWLWGFVLWIAVAPAMFIENTGLGAAIGRSRQLVQGRWWRTFLVLFLAFVVYEVVAVALGAFLQLAQYLLTIFVSPFVAASITAASSVLISALVAPIIQIVVVLIYFDLRVRREALDLFQIAYRIAAPAATG
ncbi:MAG TPA: hypothetical protein VJP81_09305 [Candidatus Dormibacteraeota bacterium]|nr:hypothetical protein [Candidatus Dormibacteraeota bacterium]